MRIEGSARDEAPRIIHDVNDAAGFAAITAAGDGSTEDPGMPLDQQSFGPATQADFRIGGCHLGFTWNEEGGFPAMRRGVAENLDPSKLDPLR